MENHGQVEVGIYISHTPTSLQLDDSISYLGYVQPSTHCPHSRSYQTSHPPACPAPALMVTTVRPRSCHSVLPSF